MTAPNWTPPAPDPVPHPSGLPSDVRAWGIAVHLGGLGLGLLSVATLGFLVPLLVWLLKRDEHPYLEHHGKEALNFQLTVLAVIVGSVILAIPVAILGILTLGVGLVLAALAALAAAVLWVLLPILAAVAASKGEGYRYPFTIRFVR